MTDQRLHLRDVARIADQVLLIFSLLLLVLVCWNIFVSSAFAGVTEFLYIALWIAFIVEFVVKLYLSADRLAYLRKEFFVVFIILFPFLRPLRLFPFSRFGLLIFAEQVSDRFPFIRRYRVFEILLVSIVLVILSADLFLLIEREPDSLFHSFGDALWFSVVTVATVGYGDIFPKTLYGRILASLLIIFGVSIFGIVTASISSYLVEQDFKQDRKEENEKMAAMAAGEQSLEHRLKEIQRQDDLLLQKLEALEKRFG